MLALDVILKPLHSFEDLFANRALEFVRVGVTMPGHVVFESWQCFEGLLTALCMET